MSGYELWRHKEDETVLYWVRGPYADETTGERRYDVKTYDESQSFTLAADFFEEVYEPWKEGGWLPGTR